MSLKLISGVKDLLSYVYDLRAEIVIIAILFTIFYVVGFSASLNNQNTQGTTAPLSPENVAYAQSMTTFSSILSIILTNVVNSLIAVILGLALGFVPVLFAITNGLTIGMFVGTAMPKTSIFLLIAAMVPYVTFQIPALLLTSAVGLRLGYSLIKVFSGRKGMLYESKKSLAVFIFLILPLLILAAIIQATISNPLLLSISV